MPLFLYSTLFSLFSTRLLSVILQRRIAEPQIFIETLQAAFRACPLTLRVSSPKQWERYAASRCTEAAEAYGSYTANTTFKENLRVFCRAQTSASPVVRLLRPHATASAAMHFCVLSTCRTSAPLRLRVKDKRPAYIEIFLNDNLGGQM